MVLGRRKQRSAERPTATTDLYYASDVHGSDQCWRKFLGAGRFYHVGTLIMGGDLVGKAIIPIESTGTSGFSATFLGETHAGTDPTQLQELMDAIRYNGMYPWVATADEIHRHEANSEARDELFDRIMLAELQRWIDLADDRMGQYGIDVYVMAGNDDPWSCDDIINSAKHVQACDDLVVRVGSHEMISCSYANRTPWNSPRELDENELYARINRLAEQLEDPASAIFNLHVPPYDSGLDRARKINPDLTVAYESGQPVEIPVGSHAVRQIIEEYQPLLALHGHIHESRGAVKIGRTLAINSGSEYNSGRIHGVVVKLAEAEVVQHQFVVG